ncbi:MAG: reverse gyrase, partial [Thermoprotei archaeon]
MKAKFVNMCPNCGGTISDERLELKLPCKQCLPEVPEKIVQMLKNEETFFAGVSEVRRLLKERDALKNYEEFYRLEKEVEDANKLFYKATGNKLWSAQKTWLRRVISNRSFAVLAPTGVGKTLFGTFTAVYLAKKEKENKSIIILPTSLLVKQVYERAKQMAENLGLDPERTIIAYLGRLTGKKREEVFNRIRDGDFNVLIVTSQFLRRNFKIIWNEGANKYSFVFVDDVDAILRSSKNIDQVLMLLGLPQDAVADALKLIYLKRRIAGYYARRQQVPEELYSELNELKDKLEKILKGKLKGCLVISTATGKPRGTRVKLFRELLGFEIGARTEALRNVVDSYVLPESEDIDDEVVKLIKTLGKGGLVFVPVSKGLEYAQALNEK